MFVKVEIITLIYLCVNVVKVMSTSDNPNLDLEFLYSEGVDHYLSNQWSLCAKNIELAIEDWHWWLNSTAR